MGFMKQLPLNHPALHTGQVLCNLIKIRSLHLIPIFCRFYYQSPHGRSKSALIMVMSGVNMNTFSVYRVCSKTHMLVLSAGFCRIFADSSVYNTLMLTPDVTPKGVFQISHGATSKQPIENREHVWRSNFNQIGFQEIVAFIHSYIASPQCMSLAV